MIRNISIKSLTLVVGLTFCSTGWLQAQNTSNVFSPDVNAGAQAAEFRLAFDPGNDSYASRIHYQYGFNESLRMRLIAAFAREDGQALETDHLRWETQYQFLEDEQSGWDAALRLGVQLADGDDRPSRVRLAGTGKWGLSESWEFRLNLLGGVQVGPERGDGLFLEARSRLAYRLTETTKLSLDLYSDLNSTADFGGFNEQEHQLGPLLQVDLGNGFDLNLGALFGVSRAASNQEYRLHLIYGF